MTDDTKKTEEKIEYNAELVTTKHAEFMACLQASELAAKALVAIAPYSEPSEPGGKPIRMITYDMDDSVRAIRHGLKEARLNALVVSQGLMNYTPEAREAAIKAKGPGSAKPDFKVISKEPKADAPEG